ncbi:MAG: nuclease [Acidobacteriota bacterium]|nr:nuclease [Acidobacteriota bacterium]
MALRSEAARVVGIAVLAAAGAMGAASARGQQLIGYVPTRDADVSGRPDVLDGRAVLAGSVAVTAKDHTAAITLGRGGTVRVCQTSVLHLTESRAAPSAGQLAAPLLLSLDRGAVEVRMQATPTDALMTPDLRFTMLSPGPLDLRLRVARNGDTCVENRGPGAPTLAVSDPFGGSNYQLNSGQHVLFEHGSLREVVDHEATPCGCPEPGMSMADLLLAPGAGGKSTNPAAANADAQHPFPAAVSEGLAPAAEVPQAAPGEVHAQVSETMTYNGAPPAASAVPTSAASEAAPAPARSPAGPEAGQHRDAVHAIGHFFKRLFGRG